VAKVTDLCRTHGMSDATFYKWKAKYGGMQTSQAAPSGLHNLESSNLSENAASLVLGLVAKNVRHRPITQQEAYSLIEPPIPRKQSGGGERL